jgi:hypothetical protein
MYTLHTPLGLGDGIDMEFYNKLKLGILYKYII